MKPSPLIYRTSTHLKPLSNSAVEELTSNLQHLIASETAAEKGLLKLFPLINRISSNLRPLPKKREEAIKAYESANKAI